MTGQRKAVPRRTASAPEREFRTVPEFARILGVGINQAYDLVNRGVVRSIQVGRVRRIHDTEIDRLRRGDQAVA